jgi:hypothetical protein
MTDPLFAIGQRVAFAIPTTMPIEGYVREIRERGGTFACRIALDRAPQHQHWIWHREDQWKPAVTAGPVFRKCSDIKDDAFLDAIDRVIRERTDPGYAIPSWASRWDLASVLAGRPDLVGTGQATQDWPGVPPRLLLAKARRLDRRGLITGCACGCRGDFEITAKGRAYQRACHDVDQNGRTD